MNKMYFQGVANSKATMLAWAYFLGYRFAFSSTQHTRKFVACFVTLAIAITCVSCKFSTFVLGIFMKVNIAQIHLGVSRCHTEKASIISRFGIYIAR